MRAHDDRRPKDTDEDKARTEQARRVIDEYAEARPSAEDLYGLWVMFAEYPYVSHLTYRRTDGLRCLRVCLGTVRGINAAGGQSPSTPPNLAHQIATAPLFLLPEIDAPPIAPAP